MGRVARGAEAGAGVRLPGRLTAVIAVEAAVFAVALTLSVLVAVDGDPLPGELRLARWIQDIPAFETVGEASRALNITQVVLAIGAAFAAVFWWRGRRREAVVLVVALGALWVMQPTLKDIIDRPRPSEEQLDRRTGFTSESFPSGHAMSGFVLYLLLAVIAWRSGLQRSVRIAAIAAIGVLLTVNAVANVYMGVHWPSDVLGGILWALVIVIPGAAVIVLGARSGERHDPG